MKCNKCSKRKKGSVKHITCWREYKLCPICMAEEHPDFYSPQMKASWLSRRYDWAKSDKTRKEIKVKPFGEI